MLPRRTFVTWLSGLGAALGLGIRPRAARASASRAVPADTQQAATLDATLVTRLAEVVLPAELGQAGAARAGREFSQWIAGYRQGAEIVHPYGSTELRNTGESPLAKWRTQLGALDQEARQKHQRGFATLELTQRRDLVTAAIAADRTNRMPEPLDASHVALALVAWYFASPDAIDRCYQVRIGRNSCRPLINAPRQPLPLANGRSGT